MQNPFLVMLFMSAAVGCSDGENTGDSGGPSGGTAGTAGSAGTTGGSSGAAMGGSATGGSATGGSSGAAMGGSAGTTSGASGSGGVGSSTTRGAVSLNILAPSGCSLPAGFHDFPTVPSGHPVTATAKGAALENGGMTPEGQPVAVTCSWIGTTAVQISATVNIQIGASRTLINLGARPVVQGQPAMGGAVVSGPALPMSYRAPVDSCTHTPITVDPATRSVWVEFHCPTFTSEDGSDVCELGPSYYFFENCTPP